MVASSPLYQPMEGALRLGYEVHIFKRVPHDDVPPMDSNERPNSGALKKHRRHVSGDITSSDSGQAKQSSSNGTILSRGFLRQAGTDGAFGRPASFNEINISAGSRSSPSAYTGNQAVMPVPPQKIRYREQGVDELLQLKLHQVLLRSNEAPAPGSTIVLATGDGNAGQFNEEGFLEPVRIALERGWKVELYAWEDGLSRAWRREFGDRESGKASGKKSAGRKRGEDDGSGSVGKDYGGRFKIIAMERFGAELVEADGWNLGGGALSANGAA
ncbi:hypothetical protein ONZ45_g17461 [Pleurotus djamor]|nr:hypothetical protein ONZ45_g17461 [Pleurotus djamor]